MQGQPSAKQIPTQYMNNQLIENINTNNNPSNTSLSLQPKICARCNKPIVSSQNNSNDNLNNNKNALKALGKYYHEECFVCQDCSKPLKPKFFPFTTNANDKDPILLCQYDYFRRHDLLCKVCDKPLRGLYYIAFGGRYDEEHFSCTICHTPCGVKKCFIHNDKLYCKYHFLKFYSKRCKGCKFPISDQYIEFPRGTELHCWHPECYGIHKYWHVNLSADSLGLPLLHRTKYIESEPINDNNPNPQELEKQMQAFSFILSKIWSVLYRFEEETASCISDMFQYLSSFDQLKGIDSTAIFVLKIECLFKALDHFNTFNNSLPQDPPKITQSQKSLDSIQDERTKELKNIKSKYEKFPRNLTTKIMIYLQLLRKLNVESHDKDATLSSFMSVITGLAHFLKLLTRYGLFSALDSNRNTHSVSTLLNFLKEIEKNELITIDPFSYINISLEVTDDCTACKKYIQEDCVKFRDHRWHLHCFNCSICSKRINISDIEETTFNKRSMQIVCPTCSANDPESVPGFKFVTKLAQLIFLLKIALVRSKAVMRAQIMGQTVAANNSQRIKTVTMQQTYIRTLNDIKRLRSRRESVRVNHDKQEARKSVILETPEENLDNSVVNNNNNNKKSLVIHTDENGNNTRHPSSHENVFSNTKTLTLDDISRIVAAEQARELRPNAFTHFKTLKETDDETNVQKKSGLYYSELTSNDLRLLAIISCSLLKSHNIPKVNPAALTKLIPAMKVNKQSQSSGNFWSKMKTMMNKEPKTVTPNKVFGVSLDIVCDKWGTDSDLAVGPTKIRIPIVMDELISSLRQMDMSVEGIFRKNGNIRKLRELTTQIDENPSEVPDLSKENAIQLSALLKKFFRELPDPVLTSTLYNLWIKTAEIEDVTEKQKLYCLVYSLLPMYNRNILEVLLSFLHWTSSFSHVENEIGSKMDIHNLSTVIAPNILYLPTANSNGDPTQPNKSYSEGFAENEGQHHFLAIEVIDYLITYNEEMVMVPKFLIALLDDIKAQDVSEIEQISSFIKKRVNDKTIDFSEFNIGNDIMVKDTSTAVQQGAT
ncbi:hypothetical protein C6P45_000581 [Maudiozyma exigua]|uniref:Uncharacterized protein n=1 Tax=Maudiozyma exigua TaxID=34358 RepID=A0A9P7BDE6_MAUEX|nr:hypothetical protein C6P45_000581 [Kazachstania exigua]